MTASLGNVEQARTHARAHAEKLGARAAWRMRHFERSIRAAWRGPRHGGARCILHRALRCAAFLQVGVSLGSFSLSHQMLAALLAEFAPELQAKVVRP